VALLAVKDIHTYIGPFYILQGVTFDAEKSMATVLLGRNGAGKTTTLRSIMGMTPPKSGKILFKGEEIAKLRRRKHQTRFQKSRILLRRPAEFGSRHVLRFERHTKNEGA
jgi:ABC-type branched-subunit amino acid transport system ATPase component